ncbi:phospholipid carrier-dependent glycosyltransferase [Cryomorpha ignava]|uniref:Phospholipid carrier-dependent glycosyltransferase n=1 Tax=Cryomorpha ignava TaxID=101383 RepID=A0A7K3WSN0_9FLAO|nr:glycosyltransferase family 39 protein [Cryomorpha ignava]NEN24699.1 phospholipid carrier-dependent glycosyltransferase [Cryomorpha ignava]
MKSYQQFLLILSLCGLTFFAHLGEFAPDLMEARNYISAREMLNDGHWITPTMNGEPRLEKPPFPTWITALSAKFGGGLDDPFSMRFPAAASATLLVFFFFGFCRELSKEKYLPLLGAAIMATSLMIIQQARTNSWDIHAHAYMLGSLWLLLRGWRKGGWRNFTGAGILMGLSILSKGPVPLYVLWLPFILAYGFGYKNGLVKRYWKQTLLVFVLGLIVGFGWRVYIYLELPEVMEYVINKETTSWGDRHVHPFYFYLHFPVFIGIWSVFVIASFFYKYAKERVNRFGNYRFALLWILISVLLLSVIPTKKERYLLPVMIPMALMATYMVYAVIKAIQEKNDTKWDRIVLRIFSIIIGLAGAALPIVAWVLKDQYASSTLFIISVIITGILGLRGWYLIKSNSASKLVVNAMAIVAVVSGLLTPQLSDIHYQYPNFRDIAEIQKISKLQGIPTVSNSQELNMKMVWAVGGKVGYINFSEPNWESSLPAVLICGAAPAEWMPIEVLERLKFEDYGVYDYFRKNSEYKAHVYYVSKLSD